jgi:hypothetical protein
MRSYLLDLGGRSQTKLADFSITFGDFTYGFGPEASLSFACELLGFLSTTSLTGKFLYGISI